MNRRRNQKKEVLVAKPSTSTKIILVLGAMLFPAPIVYFFVLDSEGVGAPLVEIVIGGFFLLLSITLIIASAFLETWTIKGDALHISTLAKKKPNIIPLEEIRSYAELSDEKSSRKDLILFTANKKYQLHSSITRYSIQFQQTLTRGKSLNEEFIRSRESESMNLNAWLALVAGLGLFLLFTYNCYQPRQEFNPEQYIEVSGTLESRLHVEHYRTGKHARHKKRRIRFVVEEHDSILFEIEDRLIPFAQTKRLAETVFPGDSIVFFVKESLDSILRKSQSGTIMEWLTTSRLVEIHGFRSKGYDYLSAYDSYLLQNPRKSSLITLSIGIILIILGIILFIRPDAFPTTKSAISNRK